MSYSDPLTDPQLLSSLNSLSVNNEQTSEEPKDSPSGSSRPEKEGEGEKGEEEEEEDTSQQVKLFVGQVPKTMDEEGLYHVFADYGPIADLSVIRDKVSNMHKGCALVTYCDKEGADRAREGLHGKVYLEGSKKAVQIRDAIQEDANKLFVGMISRQVNEEQLKAVFAPYGEIKEIHVIRSTEGASKGCAFLKYVSRDSAEYAIATLHDKVVMEGANRPLIVKFAEQGAHKEKKEMQKRANKGYSPTGPPSAGHHASPTGTGYYNGQQQAGYYPPSYSGGGGYHMPPQQPYYGHGHSPNGGYGGSGYGQPRGAPVKKTFNGATTPPPPATDSPAAVATESSGEKHAEKSASNGDNKEKEEPESPSRPKEGPPGANLFIYHLPPDLTDADLATAFDPFGNVISAKVYVDKFTGESKGFGFVSYDDPAGADKAIEQMNRFQIGAKRLKVQHKRVPGQPVPAPSQTPLAPYAHANLPPHPGHPSHGQHDMYGGGYSGAGGVGMGGGGDAQGLYSGPVGSGGYHGHHAGAPYGHPQQFPPQPQQHDANPGEFRM